MSEEMKLLLALIAQLGLEAHATSDGGITHKVVDDQLFNRDNFKENEYRVRSRS